MITESEFPKIVSPKPFEKIRSLNPILNIADNVDYKKLGLKSAFYNSIPTRIFCAKCLQGKNRKKSKAFKHCKSLMHHIVREHQLLDRYEYPTLDQSLRMVEIHSIMLQLGVVGKYE